MIELICVISILAIILSIGIPEYKIYKKISDDISIRSFIFQVEDILSYGKMYSKSACRAGIYKITNINDDTYVEYRCYDGKIKKNKLPIGIKTVNRENYSLDIGSDGNITSKTIRLIDVYGKQYKITIRPAGNIITISGE